MIAQVPDIPGITPAARSGPDTTSMVALVLAAVLGVVLLVVLWAVFIRKPARAAERGRLVESSPATEAERSGRSSRRRKRRRDNGVRNPTLAETGGLPEVRIPRKPPTDP